MEQVAFITGADRGLGLAMVEVLAKKGWKVFAGCYMPEWPELVEMSAKYAQNVNIVPLDVSKDDSVVEAAKIVSQHTDRVDLLINNAGVNSPTKENKISEEQDYDDMKRLYNVNAMGPLRVVEAFLPIMDKSSLKRLCFVSSEAGSINFCHRQSWYGYSMSKAALNMGVKILFNRLRPEGFTFRLYHPGWVRSYMSGVKNLNGELEADRAAECAIAYFLSKRCNRGLHSPGDEDRLVMRDWKGSEWPW
ncbi:SDR family NAD(P)-dependent oxidoreductase [Clostridium thermarum]|uniref:SDR family NAD(P)-dependent oxidoreductase n=1 Tax=Clostridium thermarum TaxID=1716543 RepID=UPI0013D0DD37|nr:SDR family NAD(P)-dependent oxidoreductase [Clostridium thermarum]